MLNVIPKAPLTRALLLVLILFVAIVLRVAEIRELPLWMDEAYSFWFSSQSWHYLWAETPKFENHPPAYFLVLKAWREIAGSSEFALRIPSTLASLGAVLAIFAAGRSLGAALMPQDRDRGGWVMGLLAALIAALSLFQITYAGEARPYAFASLGAAVMLAGTLAILCPPPGRDGTRSIAAAVTLVAGMVVTLWSHSLGLVPFGLTGLYLIGWWALTRRDAGGFVRLMLMAGAVGLLCWPHFVNIAAQMARDYSAFWISPPSLYDLGKITYHVAGLPGLPFGPAVEAVIAALLIAAGLAGLWRLGRHTHPAAALLPVVLAGGYWIVLVAYTYLKDPVLLDRTLIYMHPPVILIFAAAPWAVVRGRNLAAGTMVALALLASVGQNDLRPGDRRYGIVARHIAELDPDAPVLAIPSEAEVLLGYYESRMGVDFDLRTLPEPFPPLKNGVPNLTEWPEIDRETLARAAASVEGAPSVWVMGRRHKKEVKVLREMLRAAGWEEEILFGELPGGEVSLMHFEARSRAMAETSK